MANTIEIIIKATDKASGVLQGFGANVQTIGKLALGGLAAIGAAAAGAAIGIAKLAIEAAPLQQVSDAFAGLAESADVGADEMLAALQRGSAGMVANRDLMMTFNKAAQLVSIDFAKTLPDAMGMLGKVAAATGEDVGFMLDSLVTGVGRLSPMILDNLGIQVDLTAANEAYAAELGKTTAELTKSEQQTGLMNQVMAKLAENTAAMPDITGSAAQGIASWGAKIQNLKDDIGLAFVPVLNTLLGIITKGADKIIPKVTEAFQILGEVVDAFAAGAPADYPWEDIFPPALADFMYELSDIFEGIIMLLQDVRAGIVGPDYPWEDVFPPWLADIAYTISGIATAISPLVERIAKWISEHVKLEDILIALGIAIASVIIPALISVVTSIAPIVLAVIGLIAIIAALRLAWESDFLGIRTALTTFWEGTVKPAFEQLVTWLKTNIPIAINILKGYWENTLLPALETVWAFIQNDLLPIFKTLAAWWVAVLAVQIQALASLWQNVLIPAMQAVWAFIQDVLLPLFNDLVTWLKVNIPVGIEVLKGFWENTLLPAIRAVWAFIQDVLIPLFNDLVAWLKVNIPVAIEALKDFWENVLVPAMQAVWAFIQDTLIPLFNDLVTWLQTNIPVAIEALKGFWEDTLLPAIRVVWAFIQDDLIPLFNTLVEWLQTNIPVAIEALRGFWEDTLLPAIKLVWAFIQDDLIPLFNALVELWKVEVTLALTALAGLWENVLLPAFTAVWGFIQDSVIPIFKTLLEAAWTNLQPKLQLLATFINVTLPAAFAGLQTAIQWVIDKIAIFTGALATLKDKLPDWLTPGSPSPLETALRGIAGAIEDDLEPGLGELIGKFKELDEDAGAIPEVFNDIVSAAVFLNIAFDDIGDAFETSATMAEKLIHAIHTLGAEAGDMVPRLFAMSSALSGLGGIAARRLEDQLDPLRAEIEGIHAAMMANEELLATGNLTLEQRRVIQERLLGLQEALGTKTFELTEQEEKLLALREKQADLQFLQQQAKLLALIEEHQLDAADVMGGLALGIDAEASGIVEAMTRAMEAILAKAEEELGISSPSKAFMEMGQQALSGFVAGLNSRVADFGGMIGNAGASLQRQTINNFNMNVSTRATAPSVRQDFEMMRALAQ